MQDAKPTITSLARELGLSTCTVSKVLNRSFDGFSYAPKTIRRVNELARRRGYVPNIHARSLRTKRSMTVGLVVPSGMPYFTGMLVECIEGALHSVGYETIVGHSTHETEKEAHLLRTILQRSVDGLLWIPYSDKLRPKDLSIQQKFPLVILDRPGCSERFPTVVTDNRTASRELAEQIAAMGSRKVVILTSDCGDRGIAEREEGVRDVFGSNMERYVAANDIVSAKEAATSILPELQGGSVLCLTQLLALGTLQAMRALDLRPGVEVGFACFDGLPMCDIWHPSLCRVEQDIEALGREGVRLLLEKIRDPSVKQPLEVRIAALLIKGNSVVPSKS